MEAPSYYYIFPLHHLPFPQELPVKIEQKTPTRPFSLFPHHRPSLPIQETPAQNTCQTLQQIWSNHIPPIRLPPRPPRILTVRG
ncbi:hypothetical protein ACFX2G_044148 [Malus domestica]